MKHSTVIAGWAIAAIVAVAAAVAQTSRLQRMSIEMREVTRELREISIIEASYRQHTLRLIRKQIESDSSLATVGRQVYMLVDTKCLACEEALRILSEGEPVVPIVLSSFLQDAEEVRDWVRSTGTEARYFRVVPVEATPLGALPRGITPVYLETDEWGPTGIYIGRPRIEWMKEPTHEGSAVRSSASRPGSRASRGAHVRARQPEPVAARRARRSWLVPMGSGSNAHGVSWPRRPAAWTARRLTPDCTFSGREVSIGHAGRTVTPTRNEA